MKKGVLKKIAKKYGVTVEEVRRDMQAGFDEAFTNPDGTVREDKPPSLEAFIKETADKVRAEMER